MAQYINEYTRKVSYPDYKQTNFDPTIELSILAKKQDEYNRILDTVSTLRNKALSIDILNKDGVERLKGYNDEINSTLSGDLGDLTDVKNQARIADVFKKVANDNTLLSLAKTTQKIKSDIASIARAKAKGEGYSAVNEAVYYGFDGGVYDFINRKADDAANMQIESYVPFKDTTEKYLNIQKSLKDWEDSDKKTFPLGNGYMRTVSKTGVSVAKAQSLVNATWNADDEKQIEINAKYELMKMKASGQLQEVGLEYDKFMTKKYNGMEWDIKNYTATADETEKALKERPETFTEDQRKVLSLEVTQYRDLASKAQGELDTLKKQVVTPPNFQTSSLNDLLPFMQEMNRNSKMNAITNTFAKSKTEDILSNDSTYFNMKQLSINTTLAQHKMRVDTADLQLKTRAQNRADQEFTYRRQNDAANREADFLLASMKANGEGGGGGGTGTPGTPGYVPPQGFSTPMGEDKKLSTSDELEKQHQYYWGKVQPAVTDNEGMKQVFGGIKENLTVEDLQTAKKKLPQNYEVAALGVYLQQNGNEPVKAEGFKTWLKLQRESPTGSMVRLNNTFNDDNAVFSGMTKTRNKVLDTRFSTPNAQAFVNHFKPYILNSKGEKIPATVQDMRHRMGEVIVDVEQGREVYSDKGYREPGGGGEVVYDVKSFKAADLLSDNFKKPGYLRASEVIDDFKNKNRIFQDNIAQVKPIIEDAHIVSKRMLGTTYTNTPVNRSVITQEIGNIMNTLESTGSRFPLGTVETNKYITSITVPEPGGTKGKVTFNIPAKDMVDFQINLPGGKVIQTLADEGHAAQTFTIEYDTFNSGHVQNVDLDNHANENNLTKQLHIGDKLVSITTIPNTADYSKRIEVKVNNEIIPFPDDIQYIPSISAFEHSGGYNSIANVAIAKQQAMSKK